MLDDWSDFEYVCDELHPGNYLSVEFFLAISFAGTIFSRANLPAGFLSESAKIWTAKTAAFFAPALPGQVW